MRRLATVSLAGILVVMATSLALGGEESQTEASSAQQIIEKAIKNLEKHKTARFLTKMEIKLEKTMFFLVDLAGETVVPEDKVHLKGKVGFLGFTVDTESIRIGDIKYQRDPETGVWSKVEKKEKEKEDKEAQPKENPVEACGDFAQGSEFKQIGETKLRGVTCLVYRFKPTAQPIKRMGKGDQAEGTILIGKQDQTLRKLFIKASGRDPKQGKMEFLFHMEFCDFFVPNTIEPHKFEEGNE